MTIEVVLYGFPVLTKFEPNLIKLENWKRLRYIGDVFDDDIISSDYKNLSLYEDYESGDIYSTVIK
jgi:hypothetical protein